MSPDKNRKSALSPLAPHVLGRPMTCGNTYVRHFPSFQTFLRHNVGNPASYYYSATTTELKPLPTPYKQGLQNHRQLGVASNYKLLGAATPSIYSYTNPIIKVHHTF